MRTLLHATTRAAAVALIAAAASAAPDSPAPPRRLAVLQFQSTLQGDDAKALGDRLYFSERVRREALRALPGVDLMSAQQMQELASSNDAALAGCDDQQCVQVGRLLGADLVVDGAVTKVGRRLILVLRLVETKGGREVGAAEASGKDADELLDACGVAVDQLLAPLKGAPAAGPAAKDAAPAAQAREVVVPFASEPPGAAVLLDGKLICPSTPCARTVAEGEHELELQKDGFETGRLKPDLRRGAQVSFTLARADAELSIETAPAGLLVAIDGRPAGKSPVSLRVAPGVREAAVLDPCFTREAEKVALGKGGARAVRLSPAARTAAIKLSARSAAGEAIEARALVDGKPLGPVPGSFRVPLCAKELELRGQSDARARADLHLKEAEVNAFDLLLSLGALPQRQAREVPAGVRTRVEPRSGLVFVELEGGPFRYGCESGDAECGPDESAARPAGVRSFWLGRTEVTVEAWARCVLAGACKPPVGGGDCNRAGRERHPVNCVDFEQARGFCRWIGGRLPTAEEWEWAAKAGAEGRRYPWGAAEPTGARAQFYPARSTAEVGTHPDGDSRHGLSDLAGNVWEWTATELGNGRELRGGAVGKLGADLRSSAKIWLDPKAPSDRVGFRCAL